MYLYKSKRSPYYQIIYFIDGKRTSISTKKKKKVEATRFMLNFQIPDKKKEPVINIRLKSFELEYVDFLEKSKSKSYIRSVRLSFRQLVLFTGDLPILLLNFRILERFITTCYTRSKSASALYYRTLKAAFNKAIDWEYIHVNPLAKIKTPKIPKSIPKFFTEYDIQLIIKNTTDIRMKQIIIFAFNTGMRVGEIVNIKWSAIDLREKLIYVRNSSTFTTKSGKERIIPMNDNVLLIVNNIAIETERKFHPEFVFLRNGFIKFTEDLVSKRFKKILKELQFPNGFHFHSLRHSFASNLVQRGVSLYVVKELLGHSSITVTQVYSHLHSSNLVSAVKLLEESNT